MDELRLLCRTCGNKIDEETATKLVEESQLVALIEDLTLLCIEFDNNMPEYICVSCKNTLDFITKFRLNCVSTHEKLLATKNEEPQKAKDDSKDDDTRLRPFESCEVFGDGEEDDELIEEYDEYFETIEEVEQEIPIPQAKKPKPKKPRKKPDGSKALVCELCGNVFKCAYYLKMHMMRHTGKKKFVCDICQAGYYTQNEMMRHRILHSDARPYACKYCDKTFRSGSSKVNHERTHTNERPFLCQYCHKRFMSSSTLQRHELIHTDVRNYHCETCDIWFLRSSHLYIHQRTKLHQKRVDQGHTD